MKKTAFLLLFLITSFASITAQYTLQGSIKEKKNATPMELTSVRLLTVKDSTLASGAISNPEGKFRLSNVKAGSYILSITNIGYKNFTKNISVKDHNIELGIIEMEEDAKVLDQVDINGTAVQVMVRNDTVEYNAASVKTTENAVVEDVLKKLPGVEIDSDGKITVNGQEIKKIRVDGKKFFGNDLQMATKNLPADMIDKIQVIDQKSDMAQLTGFEDDDTERIINLTTRKEKKQGIMGNVSAGVGLDVNPEFRYDGNAFLNIMNGESRSTLTAGANNTNSARSGRGRGGFGGGQNSGIATTQNFGYNINFPLNKKLVVGGDVSFNHSNNVQQSETNKESYLKDQTYLTNSTNNSNRGNYETNLRFEIEWKPDSLNTFVFQPTMGYTRNLSNNTSKYVYYADNDTTSWGHSANNSSGNEFNGGFNLIYSRKFKEKKGRALTTNINTNFSENNSAGQNYSERNTLINKTIVDQRNENSSARNNFGARISYVEPLWKNKHFLETVVSVNSTLSNSTRNLFDKDANGDYNLLNSEYSNSFDNQFYKESLEMNYRFYQQDFNFMFGVKLEPSQTYSTLKYGNKPDTTLNNNVVNFAPSAQFKYNFNKKQYARIDYRGRTSQPSISQMQPVKNNTDLMNETVGNPSLNPSFTHNIRVMYSTYSQKKFSSFNIGLNGEITKDNLTTNSIYDQTGKRYIQTINSKLNPYYASFFTMFNTPIIQKRLQFNTNGSVGFRQQYGYTSKNVTTGEIDINNLILGDLSDTKRVNASEEMSLTFTHDLFDLGTKGGFKYSKSTNNLNPKQSETYDWSFSPNLVVRPTEALTFSTDLNYITLRGYSNFNQDQWLWNASLDWSLMRRRGVLSLRVNDILHQQLNIRQTVGENYIQYSKFNALQTYFLVSFSLKIAKFGGRNKQDDKMENPDERRWRRDGEGDGPPPMMREGGRSGMQPPPGMM